MIMFLALLVSIPVWCDLEGQEHYQASFRYCVSIPVWCDLEHERNKDTALDEGFQFQYGAIWSSR